MCLVDDGGDVEGLWLKVLGEFPLAEFADVLSRKGLRWLVCIA